MSRPRRLAAAAALALGAAIVAPACSTPIGELCSVVCDCEHCNSYRSADVCDELDAAQSIAEDYGCDAELADWVSCAGDHGQCVDSASKYTTHELGHCNQTSSIGVPCTSDADCQPYGPTFGCGADGTCSTKMCAVVDNQGGGACTTDIDCPLGADRCAAQVKALSDCEAKASRHGGAPLPEL